MIMLEVMKGFKLLRRKDGLGEKERTWSRPCCPIKPARFRT